MFRWASIADNYLIHQADDVCLEFNSALRLRRSAFTLKSRAPFVLDATLSACAEIPSNYGMLSFTVVILNALQP